MLKRKCAGCGKSIEKSYNFCPYCGLSFKVKKERENYGMLGRDDMDDFANQFRQEIRLPFGLDKMMNNMIKQLNKELANMNPDMASPHGFKIQISTGKPVRRQMPERGINEAPRRVEIPIEEIERRKGLPREEAESYVRRLPDRIVYEISVPGVTSNKDIVITKLENSMEIKAFSKDKCYCKRIPLKVEIIGCYVRDNKLFVELKS